MPRTVPIQPDHDDHLDEIKKNRGLSVVSTDTCISRPIVTLENFSSDPSPSHLDQVRQESPMKALPSPVKSLTSPSSASTILSYQRVVDSLEEEVKALKRSLEIQRQGEASRLTLELDRQAEKYRREIESLRKSILRGCEAMHNAEMSEASLKHSAEMRALTKRYSDKLSEPHIRMASTGMTDAIEPKYLKWSGRYEDEQSLSLVDKTSSRASEDPFDDLLLEKEAKGLREELLVKENKLLKEALSRAEKTASNVCPCCKKLASVSDALNSHVKSLKYF